MTTKPYGGKGRFDGIGVTPEQAEVLRTFFADLEKNALKVYEAGRMVAAHTYDRQEIAKFWKGESELIAAVLEILQSFERVLEKAGIDFDLESTAAIHSRHPSGLLGPLSFALKASVAFAKRLPFTFLIHAVFIALMAIALHWMRRRIRKSAQEKPDLQRALPILDLPVSTAFALSMLLVPSIYVNGLTLQLFIA